MSSSQKDGSNTGANRLMSIHSMLGSSTSTHDHRRHEVPRPASAQENTHNDNGPLHSSGYRASSQPPIPGVHDGRFFPLPKHESSYGSMHQPLFQASPQHNRFPNGSGTHSGSLSQFHVHNQSNLTHANFAQSSSLDREREREAERRREREAERVEANRTPVMRLDSLPRSHQPSPMLSVPHHHHHHVHTTQAPFKKPKFTIKSQKVFEEASLYPEIKLGHWTYNPTMRLPFRLRINAIFTVQIPRRFIDPEKNSALQRRKVWGTEIYTDDSDLAALVLHATSDALPRGDLIATFRVMPRLLKYKSSMNGDLRSRGWNAKHDGLSLYVERTESVPWAYEVQGRGFAKRAMRERYELEAGGLKSIPLVYWPPQKYRKLNPDTVELDDASKDLPSSRGELVAKAEEHLFDRNESNGTITESGQILTSTKEPGSEGAEAAEAISGGGDDTIEISMEDHGDDEQTTDEQMIESLTVEAAKSSFIHPPDGSLVTHMPDILPTELSYGNYNAEQTLTKVFEAESGPLESASNDVAHDNPISEEQAGVSPVTHSGNKDTAGEILGSHSEVVAWIPEDVKPEPELQGFSESAAPGTPPVHQEAETTQEATKIARSNPASPTIETSSSIPLQLSSRYMDQTEDEDEVKAENSPPAKPSAESMLSTSPAPVDVAEPEIKTEFEVVGARDGARDSPAETSPQDANMSSTQNPL